MTAPSPLANKADLRPAAVLDPPHAPLAMPKQDLTGPRPPLGRSPLALPLLVRASRRLLGR